MGFQDVMFLPSRASFLSHFLMIVVEIKPSGRRLWLEINKGILTIRHLCIDNSYFCVILKFMQIISFS